uniref:Uncharacterized protein n=1 Tax=Chromera velia CCMP2878 TaxID=1169474 RepID=A0A0G4F8Q2_9ALVE|eukprot:Cvel_15796.t1-p1 / transcript=Cvel_15796.t1 / gene=Cvel_15796 / organism=Chromera_velia_CCMP2878 / gene_product=hypothetical protein / transcript_product=hypothetical protein / location=Cvel_scaffold1185:44887-47743(-) / protein_length=161 / sequence_SO=supercontig / SO=protein_coding / is_pseudo=false
MQGEKEVKDLLVRLEAERREERTVIRGQFSALRAAVSAAENERKDTQKKMQLLEKETLLMLEEQVGRLDLRMEELEQEERLLREKAEEEARIHTQEKSSIQKHLESLQMDLHVAKRAGKKAERELESVKHNARQNIKCLQDVTVEEDQGSRKGIIPVTPHL